MNALVASVIRTLVPIIVGHVASWLLLAHVVLPPNLLNSLTELVGAGLSIIYYVAIRVLEQQWPNAGLLLGLPASPDTYSKSNTAQSTATAAVSAAPTVNPAPVADILAPVAATSIPAPVDGGFQSKIEAAISGPVTPAAPAVIEPDYSAPASVAPVAPAEVAAPAAPATPAQ